MPGVADLNEITRDYRDHVLKYIPTLHSYNLHKAADYLEQWVSGQYTASPLLDISAPLYETDCVKFKSSLCSLLSGAAGVCAEVLFQAGGAREASAARLRCREIV